jgi:transcriptional regulator with GAF, ATPase, and Fis domain
MTYSLLVLNGAKAGRTIRLDPQSQGEVTFGRNEARELQIDDERASRLHCRVIYRGDRWHIEDCDSLNGTKVNSQPIHQRPLDSGDLIRIGDRLILFVKDISDGSADALSNSQLVSTTQLGKLTGAGERTMHLEQALHESVSQVVRDSAVLCRLANQIYRRTDGDSIVRAALEAIVDGLAVDHVSLWLARADGRLHCIGHWGDVDQGEVDSQVIANLAVEKGKPFLLREQHEQQDQTVNADALNLGSALGVPILGAEHPRGAIACRRNVEKQKFLRSALDFAMVVAHQTGLALENLEHRERLEQANSELRRRLSQQSKLLGSSAALREVHEQIARVGPTSSTTLVLGESGTGKELVALSIHELSARKDGPYIAVNCAAFPESLLESELFGHEAGAFTGADRQYIGQFERAHRGTLFLDEVGEMSPGCQAKLLRVLEGHAFQRLGGREPIHVDVRIIAATHRDLKALAGERKFREDLYYRLRVIDICLPPLRQRDDDALELATLFLEAYRRQLGRGPQQFSAEALDAIRNYEWPGNVRELKNAVERAVVLGRSAEATLADMGLAAPPAEAPFRRELVPLREAERRHIQYVLRETQGNKTEACKVLEIGRGTLYKKLEDYGLT